MRVYLAGGFGSGWRSRFDSSKHETINPEKNELGWNMQMIGAWDKHAIKNCDLIFAYMEKSNPSGYGLATEMGYACALGKTVIFVLEQEHDKVKYLKFLTQFADVVFDDLESGINFLECL